MLKLGRRRPVLAQHQVDLATCSQAQQEHQHTCGQHRCQRIGDEGRMARVEDVAKQLLEPAEKVLHGDQQRSDEFALLKGVLILHLGSKRSHRVLGRVGHRQPPSSAVAVA
jgi:hypothetical protein